MQFPDLTPQVAKYLAATAADRDTRHRENWNGNPRPGLPFIFFPARPPCTGTGNLLREFSRGSRLRS